MLIVSLTGESLRRTDLSFVLQCISFLAPKIRSCVGHFSKRLNSGVLDLNLVFMGMWGHAEFCSLSSDTFLVVYIYDVAQLTLCCRLQLGCSVVCVVSVSCFGFWIKINLIC